MKPRFYFGWSLFMAVSLLIFPTVLFTATLGSQAREVRDYQGKHLDVFDRAYDNPIKGFIGPG